MKEIIPTKLADDFIFLEAPRWHGGKLWVPDVFDQKLYHVQPTGEKSVAMDNLPPVPNSLGFLADGTPVIISSFDRRIMKVVDGHLEVFADLSAATPHHLNDFSIDDEGRIYVGNFGYDIHGGADQEPTDLHMVDTEGTVRTVATGLEFPNGSAIINDGRTFVVAETWVGRLTAFNRAQDGTLSNRRLYADLDGRQPDGICADAEGAIWASCFNTGEIIRVLDGGEITDRIQFEGSAIACCLGGEDGRTLFCSTYVGTIPDQIAKKRHGALFTARVEVGRA
ncbi:gluconolactonase [Sphingomonas sp. AP4-R1]|uniref:SMP-30/gluconolactonase/LRE family protein n=1 Tax=Sphingomonas sp. AP4-R1 TaxID=2735134 RepID=UPI001493445E|nr:SMP-30/gluconolactonase/LRE family protein [Sphingomonas sp. AP4-R1]QJU58160.1 gluconolactonase [Sphingomonas sp. AP4-R1]